MKKIIFAMLISSTALMGCATHNAANSHGAAVSTTMQALKTGVNLQFDKNSSQIDAKYHDLFTVTSEILGSTPKLSLHIQGHTDTSGTNAINNRLALARANAVRSALISNYGVSAEQLNAVGFGSTQPIASNDTEAGRVENRRVTLLLKHE